VKREVWNERFTFHCLRCDHVWSILYEVRRYTGSGGQEWLVYCRDGRPVRVPHLDGSCVSCGGLRVKVLPKRPETEAGSAPRRLAPAPKAADRSEAV